MRIFSLVLVAVLIIAAIYGGYYFFVDKLTFQEITGSTHNSWLDIALSVVDFDTEVTRYDMFMLGRHADYYEKRLKEIDAISDSDKRYAETLDLTAELMQEPAVKKLTHQAFMFGGKGTLEIAKMII